MFQSIVRTALQQRIVMLALAGVLLAFGVASLPRLRVDVLPDLNKPTVTVMTEAQGMAAEEVEQLVTFPIELAVKGVADVTRVRSRSQAGLSSVYVEFAWGTDIYRNRQQVTERLAAAGDQLPEGVTPKLSPVSSIMGETLLIAVHATREHATDLMELRELADWVVRPRLLAVPGVSQVTVIGGAIKQYEVRPDLARMRELGVSLPDVETAMRDFSRNTSGGYLVQSGREYMIRNLGHSLSQGDQEDQSDPLPALRGAVVAYRDGVPTTLQQIADIDMGVKTMRGSAGYNAAPAVILSVQKQLHTDTLRLTRDLEAVLEELRPQLHQQGLPQGVALTTVFRQADFIEHSVGNLATVLRDAAILVTLVLFVFLLSARTTLISLITIPLALCVTALAFHGLGMSINTMTLGGLAIAIGELVDDAVVGVENTLRRLRARDPTARGPGVLLQIILDATLEVRTAIFSATLIIVLVFIPVFALSGVEGRLFDALGVAYIVSILASMLISVTVTPALCYYLLPAAATRATEGPLLRWCKRWDARALRWSFQRPRALLTTSLAAAVLAATAVPLLPQLFLPSFNEGSLTVTLLAPPGTSLDASNEMGTLAERLILTLPHVAGVARRTGRAELDEHAEGVHYSELDVALRNPQEDRDSVSQQIRRLLRVLPVTVNLGQPISHRLDHLLAGVRAQLALKVFGPDLSVLRTHAERLHEQLRTLSGLTDLQVEQQGRVPQLLVRIPSETAAQYGINIGVANQTLETLGNGRRLSQVLHADRRYDVVLRLAENDRDAAGMNNLLMETAAGRVPLARVASLQPAFGEDPILHEDGQRRIAVLANLANGDMSPTVAALQRTLATLNLPQGYFVELDGQFKAQQQASTQLAGLAAISVLLIFAVVYNRYRSLVLTGIILLNIPLALIGSVIALWLSGSALSLASLVGFITLTGIATRNGLIKISHYLNLIAREGEAFGADMVVRGSLERLAPVLMTALGTALALIPLLVSGDQPGKEILHPVAVVVFGGLISATLLDTLLTPALFLHWGRTPVERLLAQPGTREHY
ncbi:MAG: efflux RND transporter permease subunit [Gammaproteobacteria bacterium]|nr:efflux RND transporter permease subunit [Gammaproteobacteria bacterium]